MSYLSIYSSLFLWSLFLSYHVSLLTLLFSGKLWDFPKAHESPSICRSKARGRLSGVIVTWEVGFWPCLWGIILSQLTEVRKTVHCGGTPFPGLGSGLYRKEKVGWAQAVTILLFWLWMQGGQPLLPCWTGILNWEPEQELNCLF